VASSLLAIDDFKQFQQEGHGGNTNHNDFVRAHVPPQPQSSQVPSMGTLLVSVDLTFDKVSATGGCQRFVLLSFVFQQVVAPRISPWLPADFSASVFIIPVLLMFVKQK
jgi:hypothetical protein